MLPVSIVVWRRHTGAGQDHFVEGADVGSAIDDQFGPKSGTLRGADCCRSRHPEIAAWKRGPVVDLLGSSQGSFDGEAIAGSKQHMIGC